MKPQPYTQDDLSRGADLVQRLHGVEGGFDGWAEFMAKVIAGERERCAMRFPWIITVQWIAYTREEIEDLIDALKIMQPLVRKKDDKQEVEPKAQ